MKKIKQLTFTSKGLLITFEDDTLTIMNGEALAAYKAIKDNTPKVGTELNVIPIGDNPKWQQVTA